MDTEAKATEPIAANNGHGPDHDLLIRVESDVRHLQDKVSDVKTEIAEVKADMKAGFSRMNGWFVGGLLTIVVGFVINYFIGR